jgi:hypothetical protein
LQVRHALKRKEEKGKKLINEAGNKRERKAVSSLILCAAPVLFSAYYTDGSCVVHIV